MKRREAKCLGLHTYINGKPCRHGHINPERYTSNAKCVICAKDHSNREDQRKQREIYSRSKEAIERAKIRKIEYFARPEVRERRRAYARERYQNSPEEIKELFRERNRISSKIHQSTKNARCALYRAAKLLRTPKWLTNEQKQQIKSFYKEANRLTKETGIPHHVDHILPLQGDLVSGFHIPENLRVITAYENTSKGNKLIEELT